MYYDISFNPKAIRKLNNKTKLSYKKVGPVLGIDKQHFLEKDNWYLIDGAMQYFKNRQDSRIIGELLSDEILRMHGFVPATYELANLNDNFGLLSSNIHKEGYRYESVATLHKLFPEFRYTYNHSRNITLKGIIDFIGDNVPNGEELKTQIIRKYVVDWFTNQLDDNIRNMVFEQNPEGEIHLAKIIDSESSFGATKKGIIEGARLSLIIDVIFLLLSIILSSFKPQSLIYYLIIAISTIFGSMIGVQKKITN